MIRRDVFQAIADPTRRAIIHLISQQPHNLHEVVEKFSVTRPAIAKHMRILEECGLVHVEVEGREKIFTAQLHTLQNVSSWVNQYKAFWTSKLDALDKFLLDHPEKSKRKTKKKKS